MVTSKLYTPDRGDIIWINLNPTRGHEQSNVRPVLVLTPKEYNKILGLFIGCPITSQEKGYPFEVLMREKKVQGVCLADQIRSMGWKSKKIKFIQKASSELVTEVERTIKMLLFA